MGKAICTYQMLQTHDPMFQNKETLDRCQNLLNFLRLVMQVVLRKEKLCWLVYNGKKLWILFFSFFVLVKICIFHTGTVYMYTVCRCLMSRGYSKMVNAINLFTFDVLLSIFRFSSGSWISLVGLLLHGSLCASFDCQISALEGNLVRISLPVLLWRKIRSRGWGEITLITLHAYYRFNR